MRFSEVLGHQNIKKHLIKTVKEQRVSHAQLFSGPEGNGKLALALAFAQYLNCTNATEDDSCGVCASCKKYSRLVHPDLHFVFPVVKTPKVSNPVSDSYISQWREFVNLSPYFNLNHWYDFIDAEKGQGLIYSQESGEIVRKLSLKTFEADYKVMIIWMPEKMHLSASNKLLKMLEEPSPGTLFILVSEKPADIIATILSRTQQLHVGRLEDDDIIEGLVQREGVEVDTAQAIAKLANGNYLKARELYNQSEEQAFFFSHFVLVMRLAYGRKLFELIDWVDDLVALSREKQKSFLDYTISMVRENFIMNYKNPEIVYLSPEENRFSAKFSPFINDRNVEQMYEELSLAHSHIEQNGNSRIIFTDLMLKLIILLKA